MPSIGLSCASMSVSCYPSACVSCSTQLGGLDVPQYPCRICLLAVYCSELCRFRDAGRHKLRCGKEACALLFPPNAALYPGWVHINAVHAKVGLFVYELNRGSGAARLRPVLAALPRVISPNCELVGIAADKKA